MNTNKIPQSLLFLNIALKKFIVVFLITTSFIANSQSWVNVGNPGFSGTRAFNTSLAFIGNTPYVAYSEVNNNNKGTVMKFNGVNWVAVGMSGISSAAASYTSLAIYNDTPYVAFSDGANAGKATVVKFDGINWVPLGIAGFSQQGVQNTELAFNGGIPYVVFKDNANAGLLTVMKFNGTSWINVGNPGFSGFFPQFPKIAFAGNIPYVAYSDNNVGARITVMRFFNGNWVNVGSPGFSTGGVLYISLACSGTTPFVSYSDAGDANKLSVKSFDGANWVTVGNPAFSADVAFYSSLAFYSNIPYVAYMDRGNGDKATVMKLQGSNWVAVGTPGFSAGATSYTSLAFNGSTPYVAYEDESNSQGLSVMQFGTPATGLNFDGIDDGIDIPNSPALNSYLSTGELTIEYWVKPTANVLGTILAHRNDNNDQGFVIEGDYSNYEHRINFGGIWYEVDIKYTPNQWQHIAIVAKNGKPILGYLNGMLVSTSLIPMGTFSPNASPLTIGHNSQTAGIGNPANFAGEIDEVRIWSRARCQSEIQNDINCELDTAIQTGLNGYYKFNEGNIGADNSPSTKLPDWSGNRNDGTLNNFALTGIISNWISGVATGNCTVFVPSSLAGSAGKQLCQSVNIQSSAFNSLDSACNLILKILPAGPNPIAGFVNTCVTIDASVQFYNGMPYVQRHYDITPAGNSSDATATITLYYTQQDFDAYNALRGSLPALPVSPSDMAGIKNLLITQYHSNGTAPGTYLGTTGLIDPNDNNIIWNATQNRWEITFDVNGFSGFFVHTSSNMSTLPLRLLSFKANYNVGYNEINWSTTDEIYVRKFILERSTDDRNFISITSVPAMGINNRAYSYNDFLPFTTNVFYRLKMVDIDGNYNYSNIISVNKYSNHSNKLFPNPVRNNFILQIGDDKLLGTSARLTDAKGAVLVQFTVRNNLETIDISKFESGIYTLKMANGVTFKLIKL